MQTLKPIVLASQSQSRRALLAGAGVAFDAAASDVDEATIKQQCKSDGLDVAATALELARAKAAVVQQRHMDALVIGADQMLEFEGAWYDKPADIVAARRQLSAFAGKTHVLHSALIVLGPKGELWSHVEPARITMRDFSGAFLDAYLDAVGEDVLKSVGGYFMEGPGVQMFARVDGDFFTVLGLPMTPLLAALRDLGALQT